MENLTLTPAQIKRARQIGCGGLIEEMFPNLSAEQEFKLSQSIRGQVFAKERKQQFKKLEKQADRIGNYNRIK